MRFLKTLTKKEKKNNFVIRYIERHYGRTMEILKWRKISEAFKDYKEKGMKVLYELDGDIIDYSDSLKTFLNSL